MKPNKIKSLIPREFKKYFWDVDFDKLKLNKHKNFILGRLLNYGASDKFNWIFTTFKNDEVKSLLLNNGKQSLSRNSYLFWKKISEGKKLWKRI